MHDKPELQSKIEEGFLGQKMIVLPPDKKRRVMNNILSKNLYPTAIGYYPHASYHDRERKTGCEQYILLYCIDGKGWIEMEGHTHILSANTYFIVPKDVPHHYGSSQKEPWSIYWLHFTGEHAQLFYSRYAENTHATEAYIAYDENRIEAFNQLFSAMETDFPKQVTDFIYIKLLQFISSFIYADQIMRPEDDDIITRSVSFMKENLKNNYHIKDFAAYVNYSVSHYSELFRRKTGYSPIQYFLQLKIQKSCQYLYFTKLTIKEISREIGFDDPYYFSRMFKKQMGQSPLKYRKIYKS